MTSLGTFVEAWNKLDVSSFSSISNVYADVAGNFVWDFDITPLASWSAILITLVGYVIFSYFFNFLLGTKTREEMEQERTNPTFIQTVMKWIAFLHNFNMTVISLACFIGLVYEALKIYLSEGYYPLICDPEHKYNVGPLQFWCYMYYLSKYVELFDTVLLVLRRSRLRFIHTYHHVSTMFICYFGLASNGTGQWIVIMLNTLVHIIMYYYYMKVTLGFDVWWKYYLTDMQLLQFILDVGAFSVYIYSEVVYERPKGNHCTGSLEGAIIGDLVVISFFFLFFKLRQDNLRALRAKKAKKD
ncbi:hypothetical protein ABK040_016754 [Willaertia magna]